MSKHVVTVSSEITEAVSESLHLFEQAQFRNRGERHEALQPLPSLIERCERYVGADRTSRKEPVRLVHHFACTGGTLITKCLACIPNVEVLSEVDPLSSMQANKGKFSPTDLIQLLQSGNRGASLEDRLAIFRASFSATHEAANRKGLRMLVRDHTHSHFCTSDAIESRPTLGNILADLYKTRAIITVRHPLDSWLSLVKNGWVGFQPGTLDEYARRYLAFLQAYPNTRIFKYEDFVVHPDEALSGMCEELDLPFPADFQALFMAHRLSGDSGRSGEVIKGRDRRATPEALMDQAFKSPCFASLCKKLSYELE